MSWCLAPALSWELQMKQIAERFGALSRGRLMYGGAMKELQIRFRLTPIYDETIREAQVERADFEGVKKIFKQIKEQNMEVKFFRSKDKPTPLAYHIRSEERRVGKECRSRW